MLYHIGEDVYVLDEGLDDVQSGAKAYVEKQRIGTVRAVVTAPNQYSQIVVEFPEAFPGGHHCNHKAANCQGQYIMENHLRPAYVETVPNIERHSHE